MKEHTVSCVNLEQIQVTTVCRQFSEFIHFAGPPKVNQSTCGKFWALEKNIMIANQCNNLKR